MVAMLSGMPATRITMNTDRIAKKDGIIVMRRADGLRNTTRKARKMTLAVIAKLCVSVGSNRSVMMADKTPLPAIWPRTDLKAGSLAWASFQVCRIYFRMAPEGPKSSARPRMLKRTLDRLSTST